MDLFIGRGARFSHLLLPRSSKCSAKVPSFLNKQHSVTSFCYIHHLGKHSDSTYQSSFTRTLANHCNGQFKYPSISFCSAKTGLSHYGTSTGPDPPTKTTASNKDCNKQPEVAKPSVFQKMKQLTKDYWHILIPVHLVTSAGWISIFYIAAKNGVDIVGILESLHLSEKYLEMIRGSSAGHWAVTYALYKIITPVRYTVTVGGTTMTIRYLNKWGYMKFKDSKLTQSLKSAQEQITSYGKSKISSKVNQPPPPKT